MLPRLPQRMNTVEVWPKGRAETMGTMMGTVTKGIWKPHGSNITAHVTKGFLA